MADFLDEKRREIAGRLQELEPLVDEYRRLESAAAALEGVSPSSTATRPRPPAMRSAKARNGAGTAKRGRPRGSGRRGNEALELVKANPGITIPEIARHIGIKQNYLYRVLPALAEDGLVRRQGRGWHATEPPGHAGERA
jgi:hypothetical protein